MGHAGKFLLCWHQPQTGYLRLSLCWVQSWVFFNRTHEMRSGSWSPILTSFTDLAFFWDLLFRFPFPDPASKIVLLSLACSPNYILACWPCTLLPFSSLGLSPKPAPIAEIVPCSSDFSCILLMFLLNGLLATGLLDAMLRFSSAPLLLVDLEIHHRHSCQTIAPEPPVISPSGARTGFRAHDSVYIPTIQFINRTEK